MPDADPDRLAVARLALGARLRQLREQRRLGLEQVHRAAALSQTYLSDVERGRRLPTLEVLDRWARALDLRVTDVLDGVWPFGTDELPREARPPDDGRRTRHQHLTGPDPGGA